MPRRHRNAGPSLESDSFLDVVANIVGILIILIVVVALRVGQSAAESKASEQTVPTAVTPVVAPRPRIVPLPPVAPVAPVASPDLLAAIDAARRDAAKLESERTTLTGRLQRLDGAGTTLAAEIQEAAHAQGTLTTMLANCDEHVAKLDTEIEQLRSDLDGLGQQISDIPPEAVTVLRHKLNPIGREVQGQELHFRVAEGRVSHIPIKDLIERLKPEIERHKDWIAKFRRHRGTIGPIDGYTMEYVVERQRLSVVEELQQSAQMMRIVVSGWKVVPEPGLVSEPVEIALRGDSRFLTALRLADSDATLTFWVYPDSFDAYRKLQEAAHAAGLAVAARPLPAGVPIAGSPNGSRSSSQ